MRFRAEAMLASALLAALTVAGCRCSGSRTAGVSASGDSVGNSCVREVVLGYGASCFLIDAGYYLCRGNYGVFGDGNFAQAPAEFRGLGLREYIAFPGRFEHLQLDQSAGCGLDGSRHLWCWSTSINQLVEGNQNQRGIPVEQTRFGIVDEFALNQGLCARTGDRVSCVGMGNFQHVDIEGLPSGIRHLGGGVFFGCAATDHEVYCWGQRSWANDAGSRFVANDLDLAWRKPVRIEGPELDIAALSFSGKHGCALSKEGRVYCFGDNTSGGWGTGVVPARACSNARPCPEYDFRALHEVISLGANVKQLVDGSCALKTDGSVWCWGENGAHTAGDRQTQYEASDEWGRKRALGALEPAPVELTALRRDAVALFGRGGHYCVKGASGALSCWGVNRYREIAEECPGGPWCAPREVSPPCPAKLAP